MIFCRLEGELSVLLGMDGGCWSDFGGRSEHEDVCIPVATALRELDEETLCAVAMEQLALCPSAIEARTLSGQAYYLYVGVFTGTEDEARTIVPTFRLALARTRGAFAEKTELRWFSWEQLAAMPEATLRPVFHRTLCEQRREIECAVSSLCGTRAGGASGGGAAAP
jgi:hypothetical protein